MINSPDPNHAELSGVELLGGAGLFSATRGLDAFADRRNACLFAKLIGTIAFSIERKKAWRVQMRGPTIALAGAPACQPGSILVGGLSAPL